MRVEPRRRRLERVDERDRLDRRLRVALRVAVGTTVVRVHYADTGDVESVLSIRDRVFDGVRYRTSFETEADVWQEVVLSLEDFRPTWRGRRVPGAPELFAPDIRSFGFMVADKQAGQFRLDVEWLGAE